MASSPTNPAQSQSFPWVKWLLIGIALLYLALVLFIPAIAVFYEAFHKGTQEFVIAINTSDFQRAMQLTLIIALIVVPINTVFGLCAAWVIARNQFRGRTLLISIIDLPFAVSPVVAGLMIVLLYGRNGWFGPALENLDIKVLFSLPGMVLATLFVSLPFVAREVIPVLEELGSEQEEAARTLGAQDFQIFWRVILPNIKWGLLYGVLLTNARAMGEFGAVAVVSGLIAGRTLTLPTFVEQAYKNYQTEAAFGAATILALLALVTLVLKEILERKTSHG
ncbi:MULTISPECIES: sulfate ABC transporter permease subunit CysW [Planktothrix]|uniref:Sulfate/thiosulfate transporter subunit membrane component of ABC superfamily n=1 Tax=Planktothrix rubescens CCAP 1459/22 TaxID=329571 RepID=A0A6J7ZTQ2_PLARU|nr:MULTISPECIES: sulfate ABC transporter permease subunit CysW [Planktothrix]CAC5345750.1 sulfate/thiosulfate transporter subunit; membrane component of ABC superfamily [Planktothrix rubescens NIVA-CYA 18]CAD0231649.1 sulfate/thiosulfate transporter subunit; membrane component of ABC superfamily [Planktothrix agardhii]CAD5954127.1 Sulfate transport system permease protein CysW [Planktothrix rubescens NIVA-CYA 18]CAD5955420.1 Sulfate transport system permease protein CysW [Planktothrix agardhii]